MVGPSSSCLHEGECRGRLIVGMRVLLALVKHLQSLLAVREARDHLIGECTILVFGNSSPALEHESFK